MISENQWPAVYAIAENLASKTKNEDKVKHLDEVSKAIAYLRAYGKAENAGDRFFQYLRTLVRNGKSVGHSQNTADYYASLEAACKEHLQPYRDDVPAMLQILGWVVRLMRYYKSGGSTDFVRQPEVSSRQAEIAAISASHDLKVGDLVDATITNIKGNQVTYTILDSMPTTQKEPKKFASLSVGQPVKVKILTMKNGRPKKLELID